MKLSCAVPLVIAIAVLGCSPVPSQVRSPRIYLPVESYDYTSSRIRANLRSLLPPGNSPLHNPITNAGATLGRVLFYDERLSRNRTTSCASCHKQSRAFADSRPRSRGFRGRRTKRNSMALVNLKYRHGPFFWDERSETLEEMVLMPIQDPVEMGMDLANLERRLAVDENYPRLFKRAFGDPEVTASRMGRALAQFLRSMVSFGSKFDLGRSRVDDIKKDFPNLSRAENRGKRIFFGHDGNGSCASCHLQSQRYGCCGVVVVNPLILQGNGCMNNGVDGGKRTDDPGRGGITGRAEDRGRFRAPSLRNIELTGPYMHDGRFETLKNVVQFYANRVRPHENLDVRLTTMPTSSGGGSWGGSGAVPIGHQIVVLGFPLTSKERRDLVAFLKTLTDWDLVNDPRFSDPFQRTRS